MPLGAQPEYKRTVNGYSLHPLRPSPRTRVIGGTAYLLVDRDLSMAADDFRQWPTAESTGIDKGYEKDRGRALADLDAQMAGPRHPGVAEEGVKNPEGEFQNPAPFTGSPHGGRSE